MQDTILTIFCLCDDLLQALDYTDDPQTKLSTAEVMLVPLVAARYHGGKIETAREFLIEHDYLSYPLSQSRLNRRIHAVPLDVWQILFALLGEVFQQNNEKGEFVIDSLPIPACDNIRIRRCKLFQGEKHRGYTASKKRYFWGLKVHMMVTGEGWPVEFVLTPGSVGDVSALKCFHFDLEAGSIVYGDRAYNDYAEEDLLQEAADITLQVQRKKNSKRVLPLWKEFLGKPVRQRIETSFRQITSLFPKHINAVTPRGFMLKLICFLLAFAFQCLQA